MNVLFHVIVGIKGYSSFGAETGIAWCRKSLVPNKEYPGIKVVTIPYFQAKKSFCTLMV